MQYTGMKDKNGKEIYEGDLLGYSLALPEIATLKAEVDRLRGLIPSGEAIDRKTL